MTKNMTTGSPFKLIMSFALPLLLGNLLQQTYNLIDAAIVGRFLGSDALASVGASSSVQFLVLGFCMGTACGFGVPIARHFGAGDIKKLKQYFYNSIVITAVTAFVLTTVCAVLCSEILKLLSTPSNIFDDAYKYLLVIFLGIPFTLLYNLLSSVLRSVGDSKTPFVFLAISTVLNIALDLVCVIVFRWGCMGAAIATVVAQAISGILCAIFIMKKVSVLKLTKEDRVMSKPAVLNLIIMGFPMGLQYSITAIGAMMMQSSLNILGSVAIAGFTAASKIEQLVTQAYVALGTTMATYCAQNMGAGKILRIRQGFKSATWMGFAYAVVTGIFVMFAGKYLTPLFLSENLGQIMGYVDIYLKCVGLFFIPLTVVNVYRNGIQGMGFGILPMMAGVAELIGRGVVAIGAAHYKSYVGVCLASPAAWVLAGGLLLVMYFHIMKRYTEDLSGQK